MIFLAAILPWCGVATIGGSSEAREAHVVSSIIIDGDWVLPLRNGVVPSKPPLFHWVAAQVASLRGGATPGVTRAVSALFAALTLAVTCALSLDWSKARFDLARTNSSTVFFCAVILSLSYGFISLAIDARVDMTLCCCIVCALYFPLSSIAQARVPGRNAIAVMPSAQSMRFFWFVCGLAIIAKGPVGIVLPLLICSAIFVDQFGLRRGLQLVLIQPRGWLLCAGVALPWYLLAVSQGGIAFIERQLIFENLQRFTGGDFVNQEKWWFYIPSFITTCVPWSLLVVYVLSQELKLRRNSNDATFAGNPIVRMAALWILVPLIFLSFASGKRHSYLLPLMPAVALLCAHSKSFENLKLRLPKLDRALATTCLSGLCASIAGLYLLNWLKFRSDPAIHATKDYLISQTNFAAIVFGISATLLIFFRTKPRAYLNWYAALTLIVGWLALGIGVKNHLKGFDRIAAAINQLVPYDQAIVLPKHARDEYFDPLLYYLSRKVSLVDENIDPCAIKSYIIASRAWLSKQPESKKTCLREMLITKTVPDQSKVRLDREIVLLEKN